MRAWRSTSPTTARRPWKSPRSPATTSSSSTATCRGCTATRCARAWSQARPRRGSSCSPRPRRAAGAADQEGVRGARGTVRRGRRRGQRRGPAGTGLGRARRPVQQHGLGDGVPAAPQARPPAADRDGHRLRLPAPGDLVSSGLLATARRALGRLRSGRARLGWAGRRPLRLRLTLVYSGLFLLAGVVLLGTTYGLVAHSLGASVAVAGTPYENPAVKICSVEDLTPNQVAKCKAQAEQSLQESAKAAAMSQRAQALRHLMSYSLAALGAVVLVSAWLGWIVAGRALRPLHAITAAARRASEENLGERIALAGPDDELKELADTFDAMLARLDAAFASQRRFVADASHELRTPLTVMRAAIDVTLAKPAASAAPLEPVLAAIGAAVDKSEELIEALLTLARSDRGPGPAEFVDLPTAVEDAIDLIGPAAAARQVQIGTALQDAQVTGDRVMLERLVSNLIDNAVKHNVTGGWVLASTRTEAHIAELTVANRGEHIPADQVTGLFEPFRRLSGRTGNRPGSGLGLSIVASAAKAHGGRAQAHARPDGGLDVQITLPATANEHRPAAHQPQTLAPQIWQPD